MQSRPDIQIKSILKAMTDVVLPAVDPQNKLAQEQARLCMGLLGIMAKQLPLQFSFDCNELARMSAYSAELQRISSGGTETSDALAALKTATRSADATLERAQASPQDVEQAVRSLREATGSLVSSVFRDGDVAVQGQVQRATLDMSREQLLRDRAWVVAQGWEADPKALPPIEELLDIAAG